MSCYVGCDDDHHKNHSDSNPPKEKQKIFSHSNQNKVFFQDLPLFHKAQCIFHSSNEITNFCINPTCFMPLCPVCVEEHLIRHKTEISSESHIKTYEQVYKNVCSLIKELLEKLRFQKNGLEKNCFFPESKKFQLKSEISLHKARILQTIELFFSDLEKELDVQLHRSGIFLEIDESIKEIHKRTHELDKALETIGKGGQKSLKQLILLNNHDILQETNKYVDNLNHLIKDSQDFNLHVLENPLELQTITQALQRYISLSATPYTRPQETYKKQVFPNFNENPFLVTEQSTSGGYMSRESFQPNDNIYMPFPCTNRPPMMGYDRRSMNYPIPQGARYISPPPPVRIIEKPGRMMKSQMF